MAKKRKAKKKRTAGRPSEIADGVNKLILFSGDADRAIADFATKGGLSYQAAVRQLVDVGLKHAKPEAIGLLEKYQRRITCAPEGSTSTAIRRIQR